MVGMITMKGDIRFGTDGWRGIIAEDFTLYNLQRVAQASALYMIRHWEAKEKGAVVGYDTRFLSPEGAQLVASTLAQEGIPVVLSAEPIPTPLLSFAVKKKGRGGGIMVTASHNPHIFNGFKIKTPQGGSAPPQVTQKVESLLNVPHAAVTPQKVEKEDLTAPYILKIREMIKLEAIGKLPYILVSDPIHGAVGNLFQRIMTPYGLKVEVIAGERNPLFGGRDPEPIEKNIHLLMDRVKAFGGRAIGVANDGDGDRLGMVDEKGRFVSPHRLLALVLEHLYRNRGMTGEIVKTFSTTSMIEKMGQDYGLTVHETAIGFKYILPLMLEMDILVGGEESGGIGVKGHIPERDGIYSALLILEKMAWEEKGLASMVEALEKRYGSHLYRRRDLHLPQREAHGVVDKLSQVPPERVNQNEVAQVKVLDGVKLLFQDGGWILFRASGTEPLLRLYCEAPSLKEVNTLLDHGEELAHRLRP